MSNAVIIGASSGVGRALAYRLAENCVDLVLVARNSRDIENLSKDLRLKYGIKCCAKTFNIADENSNVEDLFEYCLAFLKDINIVMFPVGYVDSEDAPIADYEIVNYTVKVNFLGIVRTAICFARYFEQKRCGQIITFSSISAKAPRSRSIAYSAAKNALETYFKGLRHYLYSRGVFVKVYALGYVDTGMTYGQKLLFPVCAPEKVADHVVNNLNRDFGKIYFPRFWKFITFFIQCLPWTIYKRLNF